MAAPTKYQRSFSFSGYQATNPTKPLPGPSVDNELENIERSVNETIDGLKDVRRSDGELANQSVGPDQLSPSLNIGFTFEGTWTLGESYSSGDGVVLDGIFYSARVQNVATALNAPDVDPATWNELFAVADIVVTGALLMPVFSGVGDGVTTTFALGFVPRSAANLLVKVGGVLQDITEYSVPSGPNITFFTAPPAGYGIEVRGFATTASSVEPADGSVTYAKLDAGVAADIQGAAQKSANLSDLTDKVAALENLGAATGFATRAAAAAFSPAAAPGYIRTAGYTTAGDGGGALYKKVVSEPSHAGKFSITLDDTVTVVWYEIAEDVLKPGMFGATLVANSAAALQAMLDVGVTDIFLPAGQWRSDTDLTCDHDLVLRGPGYLDFGSGTGQLIISGSATQVGDLSSNVANRSRTLSFSSVTGIAARDLLCLYNPTDYSWSGHRSVYREGEFVRVHSISGTTVTIYGQTYDPYTAANLDVYRIDGVRVDIDEIGIIPSAATAKSPIEISFGDGVRLGSIRGGGGIYALVEINRSYDVRVGAPSFANNSAVVDDEYGVALANCQKFTVSGPGLQATRHPIALGGGDYICAVPTREGKIYGAIFENANDTGAGDAHGNCDWVSYIGCTFRNQAVFGGRNMSWFDCTIWGDKSASGMGMYGSEIVGGIYTFSGNTIISDGNGTSFGYVNLTAYGPSNTPTGLEGLRNDLTLIADNNTFDVTGGATGMAFKVYNRSTTKKINVQIGRVTVLRATQLSGILDAQDNVNGTMLSDYLIVDGPIVAPSGTTLIVARASIASVPTREMAQRGKVNHTTTSAQINTPAAQSYRYRYSRVPNFSVCDVRSQTGAAQGLIGGSVAGFAKTYAVTATAITPGLVGASALPAGEAVALTWEVANCEI